MITKYPEHLTQESRLEVVKSYILHELASLTRDKTPDIINIDELVKKCHEHKKGVILGSFANCNISVDLDLFNEGITEYI